MDPTPAAIAEGLTLFGPQHCAAIGVIAAASTTLAILLRRTTGTAAGAAIRRYTCWSLAVVLVVAVVAEHIQKLATGTWSPVDSLPLHLCDIAVPVTALALLAAATPRRDPLPSPDRPARAASRLGLPAVPVSQLFFELSYFWALGGTLQAVLTPDVDDTFPSFRFFRYFTIHGGILVSVLVMTIGLRMRPQPGAPFRVWLLTLALAPPVMLANGLTGGNYMYLAGPPAHPSIYDYFGRWPWSLLSLLAVGTGLLWLLYVPFWLLDRRHARPA